jgi:hypothetical protein
MFHQSRLTIKHSLAIQMRRLKYGKPTHKVFCVGLQKTGTTSLQYALSLLGYRVAGYMSSRELGGPTTMQDRAFRLLPQFDAFADNPWPLYFKEFDSMLPGSKFILTSREPEKWYESLCKHFGDKSIPTHEWIYGAPTPIGNKALYMDKLMEHQEEVRSYFYRRDTDFIEFDVTRGDGWDKLARFLGKKAPTGSFPQLNTAAMRS